jgi:hypothetical protein
MALQQCPFDVALPPDVRRGFAPPALARKGGGFAPRTAFGLMDFWQSQNLGRGPIFLSPCLKQALPPIT